MLGRAVRSLIKQLTIQTIIRTMLQSKLSVSSLVCSSSKTVLILSTIKRDLSQISHRSKNKNPHSPTSCQHLKLSTKLVVCSINVQTRLWEERERLNRVSNNKNRSRSIMPMGLWSRAIRIRLKECSTLRWLCPSNNLNNMHSQIPTQLPKAELVHPLQSRRFRLS